MNATKNGVAVPSSVGRCAAIANGRRRGVERVEQHQRIPVSRLAANIAAPPMCDTGNGIGFTSLLVAPTIPTTPADPAITDRSVCRTPFGAAVVPDE